METSSEYTYSLLEGIKQKYTGNPNSSAALFLNALKLNPNSSTAHYELAQVYATYRNPKKALYHAKQAYRIDPKNKWYGILLSELYTSLDSLPQSAKIYEDLVDLHPENLKYKFNLANLYAEQASYAKALLLYREIEEIHGISEEIHIIRKELQEREGNYNQALELVEELIQHFPGKIEYHVMGARLKKKKGNVAAARDKLKELHESYPSSNLIKVELTEFYLEQGEIDNFIQYYSNLNLDSTVSNEVKIRFYLQLLEKDSILVEYKEAFDTIFEQAVVLDPRNTNLKSIYADFLIKNDELDQGIQQLKNILEIDGGNTIFWEQLLNAYSVKHQNDSLVLYGKLAVERFPENPLFYMFVGSGYFFEGQYDSARYYLETSLSYAQPSQLDLRFQVHAYLGDISFSLENYDQVDYHFEKALDIDSTSLYIKNNYSYYLSLREEKLEYARELSLATIEKEPGNPTYLDTYAWIVFKLKRVDEALIYIERAIENGAGNNAEVLEHYGDILKAHYRFQDAMRQYQKALLLDPGNETLQEKIKGLNQ